MGIFCFAKLETIGNPKAIARSMTSLQHLLNFAPTVDNSKVFNGHETQGFYSTLINCSNEIF